jgi:hypothetical protein
MQPARFKLHAVDTVALLSLVLQSKTHQASTIQKPLRSALLTDIDLLVLLEVPTSVLLAVLKRYKRLITTHNRPQERARRG